MNRRNWERSRAVYYDMHGLCCHLVTCDVLTCAAAKGHVWVYSPTLVWVCVDVPWSCWYPWSGLQPEAMLMSEDHAATGAILIWVVHIATWGHVDTQAYTAGKGHAWVYAHTAACVYVDVCDPCYQWSHWRAGLADLAGLGTTKLVPPITSLHSGRAVIPTSENSPQWCGHGRAG